MVRFTPSPPSRPHPNDRITLGVIRKAHGVSGEASVELWTDRPEQLLALDRALLVSPEEDEIEPVRILSARPHQKRLLLRFEGIETPEAVQKVRNWTIAITSQEARPLADDEYYLHDLEGLEIVDPDGRQLGHVELAIEGGGGVLLSVRRADGSSFDMPFVQEFCREIDLESGRITAVLPAGLENLDQAETAAAGPTKPSSRSGKAPAPRRAEATLRIDVITIFPSMFEPFLREGVLARAIEENIVELNVLDLRDFATDRHRSTDDEAYGGGSGMVMLAEPVHRCLESLRAEREARPRVVMMSPQGSNFHQEKARELAGCGWIVLLCGRYEGFDERIMPLVDEELSVGDFVVSGGEVPALLVIDAVSRMVGGVVGSRNSVEADSFYNGLLDHPQYTRPADFRGMRVPDVLLSGHAENIRKWRKKESLRATWTKRPDLLGNAELDDEAREMLLEIEREVSSDTKSESADRDPSEGSLIEKEK